MVMVGIGNGRVWCGLLAVFGITTVNVHGDCHHRGPLSSRKFKGATKSSSSNVVFVFCFGRRPSWHGRSVCAHQVLVYLDALIHFQHHPIVLLGLLLVIVLSDMS